MDRLRQWNSAQRRRATILSSAVFGVLALLVGFYFIDKAGSSTAGSPGGWLLVVLGIIALLIAFGILTGVYER